MDKVREVGGVEEESYHELSSFLSLLLIFHSSFSFFGWILYTAYCNDFSMLSEHFFEHWVGFLFFLPLATASAQQCGVWFMHWLDWKCSSFFFKLRAKQDSAFISSFGVQKRMHTCTHSELHDGNR